MLDNKNSVKNIFYSGSFTHNYDEQLIVDIVFLIQKGMLTVEEKYICPLSDYQKYIDEVQSSKVARIDVEGGSDGHIALKLTLQSFFLKNGCSEIKCEQEYMGYFPDVSATDKKGLLILAECGNTNPDKVFAYFKNDEVARLFVIPYPDMGDTKIIGYIFTPGEELIDFLKFRETESVKTANRHRK